MDDADFDRAVFALERTSPRTVAFWEGLAALAAHPVWGPDTEAARARLETLVTAAKAGLDPAAPLPGPAAAAALACLRRWSGESEALSPRLLESWWCFEPLACGDFVAVARLGHPEADDAVVERARAVCRTPSEDVATSAIRGLAELARRDPERARSEAVAGLEDALRHGAFLAQRALAEVLGRIGGPAEAPALRAAFRAVAGRRHEERRVENVELENLGRFALALAALGDAEARAELEAWRDANEALWSDSRRWAEVACASWLLGRDVETVADRLRAEPPTGSHLLPWLAAAAADLGAVELAPELEARLVPTTGAVAREALAEARARLAARGTGEAPVEVSGWMVWMFQSLHPNQVARGAETDDVFVRRAQTTPPEAVEADASLDEG